MKKNYSVKALCLIVSAMMALLSQNVKAQTWDFSAIGSTDLENLNADATNWEHESTSSNDRYKNTQALTEAALMANGTELEITKGLLFTAGSADAIRIDVKGKRIALNKANTAITIKGLKQGQGITVRCKTSASSSNPVARGLNVTNITPVSGFFNNTSVDDQTNTGVVASDGDITMSCTGGLYMYEITVTEEGVSEPETPVDCHSVSLNTSENQMRLTLNSNDIKYYNIDEISVSIDNDNGTVSVTPLTGDWEDVFTQSVRDISFAKAEPSDNDGDIDNQDGHVKLTKAKGWQESAYVEWELLDGIKSYNVYIKGGKNTEYTKLDEQLVRNYGSYGRADAVGLMASDDYSIKVVPVDDDGEVAEKSSEATEIKVVNYDRAGYAHFNRTEGVGAYNNDGTLKEGAKVLYITAKTFNTVTLEMATNNKGGKATYTGIGEIFKAKQKGYDDTPLAVRFIGTVKDSDASSSQRLSDQDGLLLKGNNNSVDMAVTVEGIGEDACLYGFGLGFVSGCDVEVRNIAVMNHGSSNDCVEVKGTHNIWIHNCDLFYAQEGSGDHVKGDGSMDAKDNCSYATFSYNHFLDTGKSILCGMKNETTENLISYHHNWFDHSDSRHPRVRTSTVHVWNNYYDGVSKYGVGATSGASMFVESNYFRNTNKPIMSSLQGTDAKGDGTFSGEDGGMIKSYGNVFAERSSNFSYITHNDNATSFDAYEASERDEQVPSTYKTLSGGTTYNNFDTNSSMMYSYVPDNAADIPAIVTGDMGAGRINHGDIHFTFNNSVDDKDYGRNSQIDALISGYKSSLVGIFGDENASSGETGGSDSGETGGGSDGGETGGGSEGGETGGGSDTPAIEGTVMCDFNAGSPSDNSVTLTGSQANYKSEETVIDGVTYTNSLKMESSTEITLTTASTMDMTLYFGSSSTKYTVKIDGEKYTGDSTTKSLTIRMEAGTHKITKADSCTLALIKLVPVES